MADAQLADDVVAFADELGWEFDVAEDLVTSFSRSDGPGTDYAEIGLRDGDGLLRVSVSTGNDVAAQLGTTNRTGLLRTVGNANVYVGVDSGSNRAVELIDGSTTVYVRSEQTHLARGLQGLAAIAIAVNDVWLPRTLTFDPTQTTLATVPPPVTTR